MTDDVVILIAEDDDGHFALVKKSLRRIGIANEIIRFKDGQAVLDFLFCGEQKKGHKAGASYVLFLDIRMPKVDGVEVLKRIKQDKALCRIPTIILTTTNEADAIETCHEMGCCMYISKPVDYNRFTEVMKRIGAYLSIIQVPNID